MQTLSWQGAYIVGQLGIAAPRTKVDGANTVRDPATITAIVDLIDGLVRASGADRTDLVALTTTVLTGLGIDAVHVPPSA